MPIVASELKVYKAQVNNDTPSNGGRMSAVESVSGVAGNLFPAATLAQISAGATLFRKRFHKVENDADLTLGTGKLFVERHTPGDDAVYLHAATQSDTQDDLTGSERLYGCGDLDADVSIGATSIDVLVEDGAVPIFADGDTIRISDKADIDDGSGVEEEATVSGTPSVAGDVVTLSLSAGLTNAYLAANTRVQSLMLTGDVEASCSAVVVTSSGGTYDDTGYPIVVDNIGGVYENWTLTFTSATAFDIVGDTLGNVGSGNVSSNSAPNNADFTKPYFTLDYQGFGGTFTSGDTLEFTTSPAAVPVWVKRVIPAGAASLTGNDVVIAQMGETS